MREQNKIAIIGAGSVGATTAYACLLLKSASSIIMVDVDQARAEAEVSDLSDAAFISDARIKVGDLKEAGQCDVIVITAGAKQRPGESRIDLIQRNHAILSSVIEGMKPMKPSTIILLVANPVDILTQVAQKISQLKPQQVFGSGTFLDSQRLRLELSKVLKIAESSIHAHVLGEHGDSQFVAWSSGTVGDVPLLSLPAIQSLDRDQVAKEVRTKAYKIIQSKGSTFYGIGGCVAQIVKAILQDTRQVRPVSHYIESLNVCLSLPAVIGKEGICQSLMPPLNDQEKQQLEASASAIRGIVQNYVTDQNEKV